MKAAGRQKSFTVSAEELNEEENKNIKKNRKKEENSVTSVTRRKSEWKSAKRVQKCIAMRSERIESKTSGDGETKVEEETDGERGKGEDLEKSA